VSTIYQPAGAAAEYAAWAVNLHGGCPHRCRYCYVPQIRHLDRETFHSRVYSYPGIIERLAADCRKKAGTITTPVLLSFTSDPYPPDEPAMAVTREAIRTLKASGYAVCILTKGGLRALRDVDLLEAGRDVVAATLTFVDPAKSAAWEPHAAPPAERFELLAKAHAAGLRTWASLEPVIEPAESLAVIERTAGTVDLYKIGKLNYDKAAAGVEWAAFCRQALDALRETGAAWYIKDSLVPYLPPGTPRQSGEFI